MNFNEVHCCYGVQRVCLEVEDSPNLLQTKKAKTTQLNVLSIGLLHNHWFLIEEGGLGRDRMAVTILKKISRKHQKYNYN